MHSTSAFDERRLEHTPIAIVGMAGLFPQARTGVEYWQNIVDGVDCTSEVPADRWRVADYYDPDPSVPDKTYAKRGGFLPDIDFSPIEFGIPPNLLGVTSSLQTLSLMVARDVLLDAGAADAAWYDPARTGVVLGVVGCVGLMHPLAMRLSTPVLREVVRSCGLSETDAEEIADRFGKAFAPWEENSFPGLLANVTAGRIANRLDLGGMNTTVDAACAASLSAVRLAVAELVDGRADMMITGGCDTENSIFTYMCFSKTGALAHSDRVRPFDQSADGTLLGEGIGMLALKRLADAERDQDRIYAVIKGIGSSSDGRAKSIYAPRAEGQQLALERAYADAGFPISSVELFEAHATGTSVGDRTEVGALRTVLTDATDDRAYAAIGSVKSQIGHTKGAAGAASLMKVAYSLHHKVLPPTIGVDAPNDALDGGPLYLNTTARPWIRDPRRPDRRAGVSAMGFGGTNFHIVLQEHGDRAATLHRRARTYLWHAPDVDTLIGNLRSGQAPTTDPVPDTSPRLALVTTDPDGLDDLRTQAAELIAARPGDDAWSTPSGCYFRARALDRPRVGALFAGQGSQYVNMGMALTLNNPVVRRAFDDAEAVMADGATRLGSIVFPPCDFAPLDGEAAEDTLRRTEFAQPAIGALSVGQFRLLRDLGLTCEAYLGHSFGELTALWAAGALDDDGFFSLARARGRAMAPQSATADSGAMAALQCSAEVASSHLDALPDVVVCNYNAIDQVVVGGPTADIDTVLSRCAEAGVNARKLPVSAAFHTPFVAHAVAQFRAGVQDVAMRVPAGRVHANTAGAEYGRDIAANREILVEQLLNPVDFVAGLASMTGESGCNVLVEFGPKQVLTQLARRTVPDDVVTISVDSGPLGDSDVALQRAVAQLLVLGVPLQQRAELPMAAAAAPRSGSVVLTGAEHVPAARRAAYTDAIEASYRLESSAPPVADPVPAVETAQPRPLPAADDYVPPNDGADQIRRVADVLTRQTDLHHRYLDGQREVGDELLAALRHGRDEPNGLVETITAHSEAVGSAHSAANEVLARLALAGLSNLTGTGNGDAGRAVAEPFGGNGSIAVSGNGHGNGHAAISAAAPPVQPSPVAAPPPATAEPAAEPTTDPAAHVDAAALRAMVVEVVAERTGYTVEMVDPGMDLEADLGVDSIKRVQIVSVVQERFPQLPELGPETLAELRTIDQLVGHLTTAAPPADTAPQPAAHVDAAALRAMVVEVVAERTGYTVEMVDPGMDLEADLGVDSIKRVQIVSVVQERFPQLPELGPETLAELRTIDQVVGHLTAGVSRPVLDPAKAEHSAPAIGPLTVIPRHRLDAVPLPPVDPAPAPFPNEPVVAVVALGTGRSDADALAGHCAAHGWTVEQLVLDDDGTGWIAADWDDAALERRLEEFFAAAPRLDACVLCVDGSTDLGVDVRRLAEAVLVAKHAIARLNTAAGSGDRAAFVTVTRIDGKLGADDGAAAGRILGGLSGLTRTIAAERPGLFARALDIHPDVPADRLGHGVLTELGDAAPTPHAVGVDIDGGRWTITPIADQHQGELHPRDGGHGVTTDDVVLVTGGGRGVTATCVVALARTVAAEFILLGRTSISDPLPEWSIGVADPDLTAAAVTAHTGTDTHPHPRVVAAACAQVRAHREITDTMAAVAAAGASVRYLAVDVGDPDAVAAALHPDRDRISVIVHGAGALSDGLLSQKSGADLRRVFGPKLAGLDAVLRAVDRSALRQVALFCSVAGVYGNSGQADYAVANEAMSRWPIAELGEPRVIAIAWGAWDGGMVTPDLRALFDARGVPLLDADAAAAAFVAEVTGPKDSARILLAPPVPLHTGPPPVAGAVHVACRDLGELATDPVMVAHRIGETAVLPAVYATGWLIAVAESTYPEHRVVAVDDFEVLRGIVFDGNGDGRHHVRLQLRLVQGDRLVVDASIGDGFPARDAKPSAARYRAALTLSASGADEPEANVGTGGGSGDPDRDGATLYRDGILFHGPLLQGIDTIHERRADQLRIGARMPGPAVEHPGFSGARYRPIPVDVVLQAAVVLAAESGTVGWLPLGIEHLELQDRLPAEDAFLVTVRKIDSGPNRMRMDAEVHSGAGVMLARLTGINLLTAPGLDEKFLAGTRTWTADPVGKTDVDS